MPKPGCLSLPCCCSVVSRSDIFKPLMRAKYDAYMNTEVVSWAAGRSAAWRECDWLAACLLAVRKR